LASDAPLIQIARLNGFAKLAQKFDDEHSVTFYVLSENFDLNYQINKVQEATKNFDLNTYWHKLSSLYAGKFEYLSSYKSEIRNKKYIMCVHGHAKPRINSFVSKIVRELSQAGFEFLKADKNDIFQLFNTFFQLPETNRKFTLDNSEVGFKINTFQINHFNATNKMLYKKYCRIVSLLQMPKGPIYDL
jgi:hypothetical protein